MSKQPSFERKINTERINTQRTHMAYPMLWASVRRLGLVVTSVFAMACLASPIHPCPFSSSVSFLGSSLPLLGNDAIVIRRAWKRNTHNAEKGHTRRLIGTSSQGVVMFRSCSYRRLPSAKQPVSRPPHFSSMSCRAIVRPSINDWHMLTSYDSRACQTLFVLELRAASKTQRTSPPC